MRPNRHIIVGTAGHVDHGKTELVKALTGVNTDRLKEEQERGISIELGFAELLLPSGDRVGLVDVPGHERFVKAMVAGAAGMDLGLLIVAADESVMPQTREHLDILKILDLKGGVVVITKCDLADEETLEIVEAEVEELVQGTFLESAPRVRVSARNGMGLDALREALDAVTSRLPARPTDTYFRLPVDRVFTLSGVGLLVTGTAWSGQVREGDVVELLPAGREARVRGVQVHGEKRQEAFAGERVALNLHGLKHGDVERGMLVVTPRMLHASYMLDVRLELLESYDRPLANRTRLRVHHGATEILGRIVLLDREELLPGETVAAQLRLEKPVAAERGDRLVLRAYSPMRTLGGAQVLDAAPAKHKRFRDAVLQEMALKERGGPEELLQDALRRADLLGATASELRAARLVPEEALPGILDGLARSGSAERVGDAYYDRERLGHVASEVRRLAADYQRANPLAWGIGRAELQERLGHRGSRARFGEMLEALAKPIESGSDANELAEDVSSMPSASVPDAGAVRLYLRPDAVRVGSRERQLSDADRGALERLESHLRDAGATPPLPSELQAALGLGPRFTAFVSLLEESGALVKVSESLLYHRQVLDDLEAKLRAYLESHDVMTMADFKSLTELSRKYAVPLLEYFDRRGITMRQGDSRRPGPMARRNP